MLFKKRQNGLHSTLPNFGLTVITGRLDLKKDVHSAQASLPENASATTDSSCKLWIKFQFSSRSSSISKWAIAERGISSEHNGRKASFLLMRCRWFFCLLLCVFPQPAVPFALQSSVNASPSFPPWQSLRSTQPSPLQN